MTMPVSVMMAMLLSIFRFAGHFNEPRLTDAVIHAISGEPGEVSTSARPPGSPLTVVSWNIERGVQYDRILSTLRTLSPDVVLLQEADRYCRRSGDRDVARDLARALGMHWVYAGEFQEIGEATGGGQAAVIGQAILSRAPIRDAAVIVFSDQASWRWRLSPTQPRRGGRVALRARVAGIEFVNLHLESQSDDSLRTRQLEEALSQVSDAGHALFAGDFNNASALQSFMFARLAPAGFGDALGAITLATAASRQTSINHRHPIDWMFVKGLTVHAGRVARVEATSDHYPVVASVSLAPSGQVAGFGADR